jgi:hypothetical protein
MRRYLRPKSTDLGMCLDTWRCRRRGGELRGRRLDLGPVGATPGQHRSFRVAIAYRGYAGDGWRTLQGLCCYPPQSRSRPDWMPAHRTVAGRHPEATKPHGRHATSPLPGDKGAEPRRSHLLHRNATGNARPNPVATPHPSPRRRPGPQPYATNLPSPHRHCERSEAIQARTCAKRHRRNWIATSLRSSR